MPQGTTNHWVHEDYFSTTDFRQLVPENTSVVENVLAKAAASLALRMHVFALSRMFQLMSLNIDMKMFRSSKCCGLCLIPEILNMFLNLKSGRSRKHVSNELHFSG